MPFNSGALIVKYLFSVAFTDEIAETQLTISGGPGWDQDAAFGEVGDTELSNLINGYATLMDADGLYWGSYSKFDGVKVAPVDTTNHYTADPKVKAPDGTVQGASAHVPPQDSVVVSLRSGFGIGFANFGRCYLPHTIMPLASGTATASSTDTGTLVAAAKVWLDDVNDMFRGFSNECELAIRSSRGTGTTKAVAEVWVGSVVDTQRRRRNRIPEAYSKQDLA